MKTVDRDPEMHLESIKLTPVAHIFHREYPKFQGSKQYKVLDKDKFQR